MKLKAVKIYLKFIIIKILIYLFKIYLCDFIYSDFVYYIETAFRRMFVFVRSRQRFLYF